ncbi:MAG: hypothetical protein AB7S48_14350 [Bacteroidales bacterium]
MKKTFLTLSTLLVLPIVLMSFVNTLKDEVAVKLSDLSSSLSPFEGVDGQDFVANTILYKVIEKDYYDKVFKESAMVYATIVQVNGTIEGINNGKIATDSEFAMANIGFAMQDIPELKDRITKLQEQLQNLKPKEDFKGLEMKKAGKAADGINIAKKQLAESSSLLPQVTENLAEVAKKVIKK